MPSEPWRVTGNEAIFHVEKTVCPNCGRTHTDGGNAVLQSADNHALWTGCWACWAELVRGLPDKVKLLQENVRLRALLTKNGIDADA